MPELNILEQVNMQTTLNKQSFGNNDSENTASSITTLINLIKSFLGSAILSLPWAFSKGSLWPSIIATIISSLFCATTAIFIIHACQITQLFEISALFYAINPLFEKIAFFVVIYIAFSACLGYSILIADSMTDAMSQFGLQSFAYSRQLYITVFTLCIVLPLCLLKQLKHLKYSSILGIMSILYCFGLLIYKIITTQTSDELSGQFDVWHWNMGLFIVFNLCGKSLAVHYLLPGMYKSLRNRSVNKMSLLIMLAFVIVTILYISFAVCAYYLFGDTSKPDIIQNLDDGVETAVSRLAMLISLTATYPLLFHAAINCIQEKYLNPITCPIWNFENVIWLRSAVVASIVLFLLIISLIVDNVGLVSSIEGALSILVASLPTLIVWKIGFASSKQDNENNLKATQTEENNYSNASIIGILSSPKIQKLQEILIDPDNADKGRNISTMIILIVMLLFGLVLFFCGVFETMYY